ncbi:beta-propeller fold lactonase family protein [Actinospica durhamensis]|uniref:Beta-propeller fold lactonase family protein n=1 Tax=Actinospica durhamensis TaxID=1508375 RepID=A0A941IRC0_9ACTN|nr:beta-propeller fold lactonase family protein [Actinospica durhamensis]MBR7838635.1 beta-propeller fold lactonase family protein [Actinospica durhamensis]
MHTAMRFTAAAAAAFAAAGIWGGTASAAQSGGGLVPLRGIGPVVFAQTDALTGNQVVAYRRAEDGRLTRLAAYDTGGLGGKLDGSVVDHLASQGSLTYDPRHRLLYAVNAGSDTVSVFAVYGDLLSLRQVVGSGGKFPVSVAVHDDAVYVLDALDGGAIQGYTVEDGRLRPHSDRHRALGLDPTATPQYTNTPGQVGFADRGRDLIVTTKANGDNVDVFRLDDEGAPAWAPVVTHLPSAVPFSFVEDPDSRTLYLTEAGPNAVVSFRLERDGRLVQLRTAQTGQSATCWITRVGNLLFASNAGSSTVSAYRAGVAGSLRSLGVFPTDPGTVDSAASRDGRFLYVQTGGNGILDAFAIRPDGKLVPIGAEIVPDAVGGEGIVAS